MWSISFSLIIIFYFSLSLFVITFQTKNDNKIVNGFALTLIVLVVCGFDTLISTNTSFIRNGKLIRDRKTNIKKYFASWMIWSDCGVIVILLLRMALDGLTGLN